MSKYIINNYINKYIYNIELNPGKCLFLFRHYSRTLNFSIEKSKALQTGSMHRNNELNLYLSYKGHSEAQRHPQVTFHCL